jgi:hypothetical protein
VPSMTALAADDRHRALTRASGILDRIRAVGSAFSGNLTLIPGASPDDGLLDLYIASPRRFRHWVKLGLRLITRRANKDDQVDQHTGKTVRIIIDGKGQLPTRRRRRRRIHHPVR